jgi:hypothetical protein
MSHRLVIEKVSTDYVLADGRDLHVEWIVRTEPGNYSGKPENCYPDESEITDPICFIDGEETDDCMLPPEVDTDLLDKLYEESEVDQEWEPEGADS